MKSAAIDITQDIHSLTSFRRRSSEFIKQLKRSRRPVVVSPMKSMPQSTESW